MALEAAGDCSESDVHGRSGEVIHGLTRRSLFGLNFIDAPSVTPVIDALLARRDADTTIVDALPVVVTPNVDLLVHLDRNHLPAVERLVKRSAYVLADGQPVVWASRILGTRLEARLAGSTLVAEMWPRVVAERRSVLVIASSSVLAALIRSDHPEARVLVPPALAAGDSSAVKAFTAHCVSACGERTPEFVFVGISYPNQYLIIQELVDAWAVEDLPPIHLGVGASFEMFYGLRRRSPKWLQNIGMEWLFRFLQEPRRLFRRYFIDDVEFAGIVWRAYRRRTPMVPNRTNGTARPISAIAPLPRSASASPDDGRRSETSSA